MASGALAVGEAVFVDVVAGALDEQLAAIRTMGIFSFTALQVADVDKPEAGLDGDFAGAQESSGRCGRQVLELVLREEARKVQRRAGAEVFGYPAAKLFGFVFGIVERRDDEVGDFEHHAALLHDRQRLEHRCEAGVADSAVEIVGEGFEINVGGIDETADFAQRFGVNVGSGDEHVFDPGLGGGLAAVVGVFVGDERLGVGVGDGGALSFPGHLGNVMGKHLAVCGGKVCRLGKLPVLALRAVKVAPGGGDGEDGRAGQKVVERLFFDGVDIQRAGVSIGGAADFAGDVLPHPAVAGFPGSQLAPFRADGTSGLGSHLKPSLFIVPIQKK